MKNNDKKGQIIQDHGTVLGKCHLEKISGDIQKCWGSTIKYRFIKNMYKKL